MKLFMSKQKEEERNQKALEDYTTPIIEMGLNPSKIIQTYPDLFIFKGFLMVDTENKKWAFVDKQRYEKKIFKIYDFKDLKNYDVQIDDGRTSTTHYGFGIGEINKEIKRIEMILYTNSTDIDEFAISIMKNIIPVYKNAPGYPKVMAKIDEVKIVLEYILNNQ